MVIYLFDGNGFYQGTKEVPEDYSPSLYETRIAPKFKPDNRSNFDGTEWHDYSETAYMHTIPAPTNEKRIVPETVKPLENPEQKIISQLALQQAQFQVKQQKLDSQLALELAQLTAKGDK